MTPSRYYFNIISRLELNHIVTKDDKPIAISVENASQVQGFSKCPILDVDTFVDYKNLDSEVKGSFLSIKFKIRDEH